MWLLPLVKTKIDLIYRSRERSLLLLNFYGTDAIANLEYQVDANDRAYTPTNLGTWSSASAVDTFFSRFNRSTGYTDGNTKLRTGNYVTIQDGTYNTIWEIAGFDMERNQKAADGTTFDNGYGICLIPRNYVTTEQWNPSNTTTGGYKSSYMHNTVLPGIVTKLKTILGSHIVQRNVLLSSSTDGNNSNAYTWTTAYATLMSVGQMTGNFAANWNKYDDGEANYKLPIFNSKEYTNGSRFWLRGVDNNNYAWRVNTNGSFGGNYTAASNDVRPLIYLR